MQSMWPLGHMATTPATATPPKPSLRPIPEIIETFSKLTPEEQHSHFRIAGGLCVDFSSCLDDICRSRGKRIPQNAFRNFQQPLTDAMRSNVWYSDGTHRLALAHYAASQLAPFLCEEPPSPPPVPAEARSGALAHTLGACSPTHAVRRDTSDEWWGILGAAVLILLTAPIRIEMTFSEYLLTLRPITHHSPDIT